MLSEQEMLQSLASCVEGSTTNTYASVQDLIRTLSSCVDVDDDGNYYLRISTDSLETPAPAPTPVPETVVYQMTERQIWVSHGILYAQKVNSSTKTPTNMDLDRMSVLLSEQHTGVVGEYVLRWDNSTTYFDPKNTGNNTCAEGRVFKDVQEFLASNLDKGIIYLNCELFGDKYLCRWYVCRENTSVVIPDIESYDVMRTYTKL